MRSLRTRLTVWMCGASLAALVVFAVAAYVVVHVDEIEDAEESKAVASAREAPDLEARDQVLTALAIAAPIGLAFAVLAARLASRRVIGPIDDAIQTAAAISIDRFDRRMEVPDDAHELRALAVTTNDLLDRLQRGYLALAAFSADASHELRTPIAAVSNELEVALRRPRTPEEWESSARTSLSQLRRLASVVDAMLRFAQADAARDADATELELADVIEDVGAIQAAAAATAKVGLRLQLGEGNARVRGDEALLAAALSNLVGNALRVTPAGGEVVVTLAVDATAAQIRVEDTGPGLPVDRSTLFVPFAHKSSGGNGLGLAITRRIIERHGGTVTAGDRVGGGAKFTIRLALT